MTDWVAIRTVGTSLDYLWALAAVPGNRDLLLGLLAQQSLAIDPGDVGELLEFLGEPAARLVIASEIDG